MDSFYEILGIKESCLVLKGFPIPPPVPKTPDLANQKTATN